MWPGSHSRSLGAFTTNTDENRNPWNRNGRKRTRHETRSNWTRSHDGLAQRNALSIDSYNETLYVGLWGQDLAHTGVVKVLYNPLTGDLDTNNTAAYGTSGTYVNRWFFLQEQKAAKERMAKEQAPKAERSISATADMIADFTKQLADNPRLAKLVYMADQKRCKLR